MANILTTGPMKIPGKVTGDPVGGPPNVIRVSIKNPTTTDLEIQLFAEVCFINKNTGIGIREEVFPDDVFVIPANNCRNRTFPFLLVPDVEIGDILRIFAKGDLDEDAKKLELSVVGQRINDQMNEPTMFFRHADLIKVKDDCKEHNHQDPISTLSANHWRN